MKIKQLRLQNYGRFEDLTIDFAPTKERSGNITVIVGNNGAGKSQILQALATGLSWFVSGLVEAKNVKDRSNQLGFKWAYEPKGVHIPRSMVKNSKSFSEIDFFLTLPNEDIVAGLNIYTSLNTGLDNVTFGSEHKGFDNILNHFKKLIETNQNFSLPIIAFYNVERNVNVEELHPSFSFKSHPLKGYTKYLNAGADYGEFFQWFRDNEDLENEKNKKTFELTVEFDEILNIQKELFKLRQTQEHFEDMDHFPNDEEKYKYFARVSKDIEELEDRYHSFSIRKLFLNESIGAESVLSLKFVRHAIEYFTEFENPRIRRQGTPTMILEKEGEELDVNQLSQGEKSLLALVGDIARRLAILNPSLDDPLQGEGVVMIDEVDLHLHPKWQHNLIDKLVRTFPNVQFILTTHSPLIVSDRQDILVYILDNGELQTVGNIYGEDANTLLNEVFDVSYRTPEIEKAFNDIRRAISNKELANAERLISAIAQKVASNNTELLKVKLMLAQAKLAKHKVS